MMSVVWCCLDKSGDNESTVLVILFDSLSSVESMPKQAERVTARLLTFPPSD